MNIYVGNLPFKASEDDIRDAFAAYGDVSSVAVIKDKATGQSRGFAFVEMPNATEGQAAISGLNGQPMMGRTLTVNEARPREEGGRMGMDSRGGRGGGRFDDRDRGGNRGGGTGGRSGSGGGSGGGGWGRR